MRHLELDRVRAVKVLRAGGSEELLERLRRAAASCGSARTIRDVVHDLCHGFAEETT